MARSRDIGTDDPRVRVRPGKGSRPRTKRRPAHKDAALGMVTRIDRGHYRIHLDDASLTEDGSGNITAMKARELGRGKVVVGDRVGVVGDCSGRVDTLARMVRVEERSSLLVRSAEDGDLAGSRRPVVANADQLVIVTALADPPPRPRMIDRYLVAAYDAGMEPILVLTKADLGSAEELESLYGPLGITTVSTSLHAGEGGEAAPADGMTGDAAALERLRSMLDGHISVLVGHSGVGKSTLMNALIPGAGRDTGHVNEVTGRGRHTSTNLQALPFGQDGWLIDTPGVRSFGIAHVSSEDVMRGFPDLVEVAEDCPRGCPHTEGTIECALDEWVAEAQADAETRTTRHARVDSYRRLLAPALDEESY